jgi:hypothetical protein
MPAAVEPPAKTLPGEGWAELSTADFLHAAAWAIICLALSAILLLSLWAVVATRADDSRQAAAASLAEPLSIVEPVSVTGSELRVRAAGNAQVRGDALRLNALSSNDRALLTADTRVTADDYPVLEYKLDGLHPGMIVFLIWRTAEQPGRVFSARLFASMTATTAMQLTANPDWAGTITEIGLDVYGDLRDGYLDIERLSLRPGSASSLLAVTRSAWLARQEWSQRSINFLRGTPAAIGLSPAVVVALWVGLAAILVWLARVRAGNRPLTLLLVFMLGWLALDQLWHARLSAQLSETRWLFSGKSQHEKQLANFDGELYRYAVRLRQNLLPPAPSVVFILKTSSGHDFERLRLQYHLLPNNVYNFGQYPPAGAARPGDFILVLGAIPGLAFDRQEQVLRWPGNGSLQAEAVDTDRFGVLYRVREAAGG